MQGMEGRVGERGQGTLMAYYAIVPPKYLRCFVRRAGHEVHRRGIHVWRCSNGETVRGRARGLVSPDFLVLSVRVLKGRNLSSSVVLLLKMPPPPPPAPLLLASLFIGLLNPNWSVARSRTRWSPLALLLKFTLLILH